MQSSKSKSKSKKTLFQVGTVKRSLSYHDITYDYRW